jgi:hypothetical protein
VCGRLVEVLSGEPFDVVTLHRHIDNQYEIPISDIANESNYRILDQHGNYVRGEDYRGLVFAPRGTTRRSPWLARLKRTGV